MSQNKLIDDIIAQLDKNIENGIGHVNVQVKGNDVTLEKITKNETDFQKEVEKFSSVECQGNTACCSPTLMDGLDIVEEE